MGVDLRIGVCNSHQVPPTSFRPLDTEVDWGLFDPAFQVHQGLRAQIQALTAAASAELWDTHVSASPGERHPALLPLTHWLKPAQQGPNWVPEFNSGAAVRGVVSATGEGDVSWFLRQAFELATDEPTYFIAMREQSYSLPFGVFVICWRCFLAVDDEGPFLFHARSGAFASFGPNGTLSFGRRIST